MRRNSTSAMGAFHPVLFFMVVYGISLFLAIFVCRTVYNTLNNDTTATQTVEAGYAVSGSNATALR